jgi:hypothetical protein
LSSNVVLLMKSVEWRALGWTCLEKGGKGGPKCHCNKKPPTH